MKPTTLPLTLAVAAAFATQASAIPLFSDTFEGPRLNREEWFVSVIGKAKFKQADGKLNITVKTKPAQLNLTSIEMVNYYPGYGHNWEFTVDLSNTANAGNKAACGFMVLNAADRNDYLWVEFYGKGGISGGVMADGKPAKAGTFKYIGVPQGSVKVSYNESTNLMTFFASLTAPGVAKKWTKIGKFSPTGSGGDVRANWKMKPSSTFGIQLFGLTRGITMVPGKVTLDNLALSVTLPPTTDD